MMIKRGWKLSITSVLAASLLLSVAAAESGFYDMKGHWAETAAEAAADRQWISGRPDGSFEPDTGVTRGEFILSLARLASAAESEERPFSDLDPEAAYTPYLAWAAEKRLASGTEDGRFDGEAGLTREDAAVLLLRYLESEQADLPSGADGTAADIAEVSDYAAEAVTALWQGGIFRGGGAGLFLPKAPLTRAEAAVLLGRLEELTPRRRTELKTIPSFDGYPLEGKLDLPVSGPVQRLVVFVNGSGPNTYDNRRESGGSTFQYYDLFAEQLTREGIAFFRSSTRGVTPSDQPPMFCQINAEEYQTYLPENSVRDTEEIIRALKQDERLSGAKVYLLGWSEGTMIAPKVAARGNAPVDALLLAGYCNGTMEEAWNWQQGGEPSMIFYRQYFDYDGDGRVTEAEVEEDRYQLKDALGIDFGALDADRNGELEATDFAQLLASYRDEMLKAVENRDDAWLKANYGVELTSGWFLAHREFTPNREMLAGLDLPIHIFHGTADRNVSVEGVYDIEAAFRSQGKTNLTAHIFENADHDLDYMRYPLTGEIPEGIRAILDTAASL